MPYLQQGQLIDGVAWGRFVDMSQGNAGLYMVLFN